MKRHAHLLLPSLAFFAALFVLAWPWLRLRFGGQEEIPATAVEAVSASASATPAARLTIPRLGIDAPIVEPSARNEKSYQQALENGIAHFPGTAMPGQKGNAYFFGHSSDYLWTPGSYKTVFAPLVSIRVGDEIEVSDASGTAFLYVVTGTRIVSPKDLSPLAPGDGAKKNMTLQTSYPLGTAFKRLIVTAELAPYAHQ